MVPLLPLARCDFSEFDTILDQVEAEIYARVPVGTILCADELVGNLATCDYMTPTAQECFIATIFHRSEFFELEARMRGTAYYTHVV